MTVGIVGSRSITEPIPEGIIPERISLILSGGAKGTDRSARQYALKHNILIEEILPAYDLYGKRAPLVRNDIIIDRSDKIYIFWDGKSRGSEYVINQCKKKNKPFEVFVFKNGVFSHCEH